MLTIRPETAADIAAIHDINARAFGRRGEADLVDRLRAANHASVSLVAERDGHVVGHILFSPVTMEHAPGSFRGAGLAPMSVLPEYQHTGIGSALVRDGLAACRRAGFDAVVVLGHVHFYTRFGFSRASDVGLDNEYGATDAFMVVALRDGGLNDLDGMVKYAPEFQTQPET